MINTNVTNIGDPMVLLVDDTYYSYATYKVVLYKDDGNIHEDITD